MKNRDDYFVLSVIKRVGCRMEKIISNIVLIGMPGCGKSTIGRMLAKKLKMNFCDLDDYIEKVEKKSIPEIFQYGEEYFRNIESTSVKSASTMKNTVISTGGGVVKRKENINILKKNGTIIFINRPIEYIVKDINIESRPLLKDKKEKIYKLYEERLDLYKMYKDYEINNTSSLENAVEKCEKILKLLH